jgi:hypothetical protein
VKATYHTLYLGEWIRVCSRASQRRFPGCNSPCSIGNHKPGKYVWYSIKTHEARCLKCFDAEAEQDRQWDAQAAERRRARQGAAP